MRCKAARAIVLAVIMSACSSESGGGGATVNISDELPGAHCPNGGTRIDTSADGATATVYACDAGDGTIVGVTAEPPGSVNCENGGVKLDTAGGSFYVCNGLTPSGGVTVTPEPGGSNCQAGGFRLDSDSGTSYVCHGTPGTSVAVTQEPSGANCAAGGFRLSSAGGVSYVCHGVDGTDGQSVMVTPLVTGDTHCPAGGYRLDSQSGTSYVCNGVDGTNGQSVIVTPEPAGTNCEAGGYKLVSSIGTSYVCNGVSAITVAAEPAGSHCPAGGVRLATATATYYVCNGIEGGGGGGTICEDADGDGRFAGCASYDAAKPGPDCNDANPTVWQTLTGYADQDLDGRTSGPLRTVCSGDMLPVMYRTTASASEDCNDADADVWQSCTTCRDGDGDGQYVGCDGWIWHAGPDCDDTDMLVGPHMTELPDDTKDNDCAGGDLVAADTNGVFVSKGGLDTNSGTKLSPKLTIAAGITAAVANGTRRVYVAEGTYTEAIYTGASIFGGYGAGTWVRNPSLYTTSVSSVPLGEVVHVSGTNTVTLDGLSVSQTNGGYLAVRTSYCPALISRTRITTAGNGIYNENAPALTVVDCDITRSGTTQSQFYGVNANDNVRLKVLGSRVTSDGSPTNAYGITGDMQNDALLVGNTIQLGGRSSYPTYGILFGEGNAVRVERNTITVGLGNPSYGVYASSKDNILVVLANRIVSGDDRYHEAFGVSVKGSVAIIAGNAFEDGTSLLYYAIDAAADSTFHGSHVEALGNVVHADASSHAVALRMSSAAEAAAMNNVFWLETSGSAVEATRMLDLYHNDLVAPLGRCLLETAGAGGYCALDIDDVNTCVADGLCTGAGGNVTVWPGFVAPSSGDYHLDAASALADRGYNPVDGDGLPGIDRATGPLGSVSLFAAGLAAVDVDGQLRPLGARWDIGLDER